MDKGMRRPIQSYYDFHIDDQYKSSYVLSLINVRTIEDQRLIDELPEQTWAYANKTR